MRQTTEVAQQAPASPRIITLQKRARALGRIRIGQVVPTRNGKTRPEKLDRFRLTSASKPLLEKVAGLYGGEVREWTPQGGGAKQWEVITTSTRLPIMVPPQPVSQFLETWAGGLCVHRCNGETDFLTSDLCDLDSREHQEARPTTRLNVVLRDVEGIGVWRLESKGWNAAMELPDAAEFLAQAGGYVEGWLSLEERTSRAVVDGKPETRRFMVPIIEIDVTPSELMAGKGRVQTPSMEGPVERPALEAPKTETAQAPDAGLMPTLDDIAGATQGEVVRNIWKFLNAHGALTPELDQACKARIAHLEAEAPPEPDAEGVYDAVVVEDPPGDSDAEADAAWQEVLAEGGRHGMNLTQVSQGYAEFAGGQAASVASAVELRAYVAHLQEQGVPA